MISADSFIGAGRARGFRFYTGVPCSYLTPFIDRVIEDHALRYVGAANEGDAVAMAAGVELGGERAVVMIQNSGLGNAVNPLSSLTHVFHIPLLLIVTLRGEPAGPPDEPQHALMGAITTAQLELLEIPWEMFPAAESEIAGVLDRAEKHLATQARPYALVMRKGTVARHPAARPPVPPPRPPADLRSAPPAPGAPQPPRRAEALKAVQRAADGALVLATTGYTGRELYALDDRPNQLYMVGSMGCVSSLALGLALTRPDHRVIAIDGDGAALMRLGAMATIGHVCPPNLTHLLLDNGVHDSTGGQATVARSIDFCAIAAACGYRRLYRPEGLEALEAAIGVREPGARFIHLVISPGVAPNLPRPKVKPPEIAARFRRFVRTAA